MCREHPHLAQYYLVAQRVFLSNSLFVLSDIEVTVGVIPGRNAVPPPQLATDTPVLNVAHPGEVGVFPLFGYELDIPIFHSCDGGCGHLFGVDIPLIVR